MPIFEAGTIQSAQGVVSNPNPLPLNVQLTLLVGPTNNPATQVSTPPFVAPAGGDSLPQPMALPIPPTPGSYALTARIAYDGQTIDILTPESITAFTLSAPNIVPTTTDHGVLLDGQSFPVTLTLTNPLVVAVAVNNLVINVDGAPSSAPQSTTVPSDGTAQLTFTVTPPVHGQPQQLMAVEATFDFDGVPGAPVPLGEVLTYNLVPPGVLVSFV